MALNDGLGIIATPPGLDRGGGHAEQEEVVRPRLVADLDIGAIQGADGDGAVHHELHVAGPGGLLAGGGDLFRQIGTGSDDLHHRDPVVGDEGQAQQALGVLVAVDHLGHVIDQLDDELGHDVARRGLAADQDAARGPLGRIPVLDAVVEVDDVQQVEQLALVFVDTLDLDIEEGGRVEVHVAIPGHQAGQMFLVGLFDGAKALPEGRVLRQGGDALQLAQVTHPVLADGLVQQLP